MAQPIHDHPLPPALAVDEVPLSDEILDRFDAAFGAALATDLGGGLADVVGLLVTGDIDDDGEPTALGLVPDEVRRWEITDDGAAQWCMAHVAVIDTDVRTYAAQRDEWQARIDHWFAQQSTRLLRRRAFFQAHLVAYAAARREADPKAPKTLTLPSGRVTSSDRKAAVTVVDDNAVAGWLIEHGLLVAPDGAEIVQTTTKVYVVPLRKVLQPAGTGLVVVPTGEVLTAEEMPPGLDVEQGHTTYDVKPG